VATVGVTPVFWINAVSFAFVLGALWLVRSPYRAAAPGRARASLAEGVRYAWEHPVVRTLLIAIAVYSLFGAPIQALLPVFAEDVFGLGARAFGLLAAVMGAGSVLGALVLSRLGRVSLRMIGASLVLSGLALAGFAAVPWFSVAVPLMFLFGAAYLFMVSAVSGQLQTAVDDAVRGRVVSLLMMLFGGVFPVGSLIGGAVADRIGAQPTVLVGAAVVIAWGARFGWRARRGPIETAAAALEVRADGDGQRRTGRPADDERRTVVRDGRRRERHGSR
jgi:predicted MFS family arabinose efflux permease